MPTYKAPVRDMKFLLHEILGISDLANLISFRKSMST